MTLAEFLLARIAEDGAALATAQRMGVQPIPTGSRITSGIGNHPTMSETRMLADCEAKRRIVQSRPAVDAPGPMLEVVHAEVQRQREYVWRLLALPFADHPDYRDEWRP